MVVATGDVRYLLILDDYESLPEIDTTELETLWFNIYAEFSEVVGDNRSDLWILQHKQLLLMKFKYNVETRFLNLLQTLPCDDTVAMAAEFGYKIRLDHFDEDFEKAKAKIGRLRNQIKFTEKDSKKEKTERTGLDGLIVALEKHQGYQFDEHRMSIKKFAYIYKSFKDAQNKV